MSRRNSRRRLAVLAVAAGAAAAMTVIIGSERIRATLRGIRLRERGREEPQEPAYLELPDRHMGGDAIDSAVADGIAIAEEV